MRNDTPPSPTKDYLDRIAEDEDFRNEEIYNIDDSIAQMFFIQLANDSILQRKVYPFHTEKVFPAMLSAQDAFIRAYGEHIELIRLDVSQIIGYEYLDSPHLILRHIRRFARELGTHE